MKTIIDDLKNQIKESIKANDDFTEKSWGMQEGVLITPEQAQQIVAALENDGNNTLEWKKVCKCSGLSCPPLFSPGYLNKLNEGVFKIDLNKISAPVCINCGKTWERI